jgi:hypothetical protein
MSLFACNWLLPEGRGNHFHSPEHLETVEVWSYFTQSNLAQLVDGSTYMEKYIHI